MKRLLLVGAIVALLVLSSPYSGDTGGGIVHAQQGCIVPTNNMVVITDTLFCAGSYRFGDKDEDGAIIIGANDITVDGNGLILDGNSRSGFGIYLNGHTGVTLRNFQISSYYYAMRIVDASNIRIENNILGGNGRRGVQWYNINRSMASAYGGGLLISGTTSSIFDRNSGTDQNVGLDMYASSGNQVTNSDFSDSFGWGIRLYASTSNTVAGNRADRVHGCRGANCSARDTAGILLVYGSHQNTISRNSITNGGDGFFIGNERGQPSNYNVIEYNDCRYAIHNAIETTFSEGNIFRGNLAGDSDYGFWLGFSHDSVVENNVVTGNRTDGIHWEHGRYGTIAGNEIAGNGRYGLALTFTPGHPLIPRYPGSERSHDYIIRGNLVVDNGQYGIYMLHTADSTIQNNTLAGNTVNLYFSGSSTGDAVEQNNIPCMSPSGRTCQYSAYNNMSSGTDVDARRNWWGTANAGQIESLVYHGVDDPAKGLIDYAPWLRSPAEN